MDYKTKSELQEQLTRIYLRLNGFFVTQLVVHSSEHGKIKTELDAVAIRMPFHNQPDRQVGFDPVLDLTESRIEVLICEVKSAGEASRFNAALTENLSAIQYVMRWIGALPEDEIVNRSFSLQEQFRLRGKTPPTTISKHGIRVRGLLFRPETDKRFPNRPFFVCGGDMLSYVHSCLVSAAPRDTCATTYDLTSWGSDEPIIKYMKSLKAGKIGTMKDMYQQLLGKNG